MTTTDKPVQRVTRGEFSTLYAQRRRIVVRIAPGDVLEFRELGRRQWFAVKASAGFRVCMVPGSKPKGRTS